MKKLFFAIVIMLSMAGCSNARIVSEVRHGDNFNAIDITTYSNGAVCRTTLKQGKYTIKRCSDERGTVEYDYRHPENGWAVIK